LAASDQDFDETASHRRAECSVGAPAVLLERQADVLGHQVDARPPAVTAWGQGRAPRFAQHGLPDVEDNGNLLAMSAVSRDQLRVLMAEVLEVQGKSLPADDAVSLQEVGFRSLDFSELALRVEDEIDEELNFDAAGLRQINTVGDVLDLLTELQLA
jgi:acyl carrier protein